MKKCACGWGVVPDPTGWVREGGSALRQTPELEQWSEGLRVESNPPLENSGNRPEQPQQKAPALVVFLQLPAKLAVSYRAEYLLVGRSSRCCSWQWLM